MGKIREFAKLNLSRKYVALQYLWIHIHYYFINYKWKATPPNIKTKASLFLYCLLIVFKSNESYKTVDRYFHVTGILVLQCLPFCTSINFNTTLGASNWITVCHVWYPYKQYFFPWHFLTVTGNTSHSWHQCLVPMLQILSLSLVNSISSTRSV